MTTHSDNIDNKAGSALLMDDYRVKQTALTFFKIGSVKVTLLPGFCWRVCSRYSDDGYEYVTTRYFRSAKAAAHSLDRIMTDEEADMECAEAVREARY